MSDISFCEGGLLRTKTAVEEEDMARFKKQRRIVRDKVASLLRNMGKSMYCCDPAEGEEHHIL